MVMPKQCTGIMPEYYAMGIGERTVLRAFMLKEIEEEKKLQDDIKNKTKGG